MNKGAIYRYLSLKQRPAVAMFAAVRGADIVNCSRAKLSALDNLLTLQSSAKRDLPNLPLRCQGH